MADRIASDPALDSFSDLPIQPTGSGVADLEIAYEQMRLAQDAEGGGPGASGAASAADADGTAGQDEDESVAHPS